MIETQLTLDDIIQMTMQVGEDWAVAHAKRLIELVKLISADIPYDSHVMELATYMHDWGAFPTYTQKGVEHAVRSRQVVESDSFHRLPLTADQKEILLETIELHDYRDMRPTKSNEALLLREADMLEFLGMMGMARDFARGPKNVETCYKRILSRRKVLGCCNKCHTPSRRFERLYIDDSRNLRDVLIRWVNKTGADSAFAPVR